MDQKFQQIREPANSVWANAETLKDRIAWSDLKPLDLDTIGDLLGRIMAQAQNAQTALEALREMEAQG